MPIFESEKCTYCGGCVSLCPVGALHLAETRLHVDIALCTECLRCASGCPTGALAAEQSATSTGQLGPFDLVVVGAGPAGSTASRVASEAGLKVLMVEKRQKIGSPVRCAEGINEEMLRRFLQPEEPWIAARIRRSQITTVDTGETRILEGEEERGYILERRVFDRALAERSVAAGTRVILKKTVQSLLLQDGATRGVTVSDGRSEVEILAKVVVAADGVESRLGQGAGLDCLLDPADCLVCAQHMLAGIDLDPECCYYYLGGELAPGGYAWVFPKGPGKANVGLGVQADCAQTTALEYLVRFIEEYPSLEQGSPVSLITGNVPVGIPKYPIVRDGLMLVGDAARQADPLTGGGIANAMLAGELAAQVVVKAVQERDVSQGTLANYQRLWREGRGRQMERNYRLKRRFSPGQRCSPSFVRAFAVAAVGK